MHESSLDPERYFSAEPSVRRLATAIFESVKDLPLLCPHGHVDPQLFVDPAARFADPTSLFIKPDHYLIRMLYSQGVSLESLGFEGKASMPETVERDPRKIWQQFASNYHLFLGTPSALWFHEVLSGVFGVNEVLNADNALAIYEYLNDLLVQEAYSPRRLFERFNIQALCTTDSASDPLVAHMSIKDSLWQGRVLPSFRPDKLTNLANPHWAAELSALAAINGKAICSYAEFLEALQDRRLYFKQLGAKATDHDAPEPYTAEVPEEEMEAIFQRALAGKAEPGDGRHFSGSMLMEMARMSCEDGLVMQIHAGSYRNHNLSLFEQYGADMGADIPMRTEFTRNLAPLLQRFGNAKNFRLVLFTLDESAYSRELAPLAGHYPALRLGPPWWFHDSPKGIERYLDAVTETAGFYNLAGFNDDTRAFCSIPARHELWRRVTANWLAVQVSRHFFSLMEAQGIAKLLAYDQAKDTYQL